MAADNNTAWEDPMTGIKALASEWKEAFEEFLLYNPNVTYSARPEWHFYLKKIDTGKVKP